MRRPVHFAPRPGAGRDVVQAAIRQLRLARSFTDTTTISQALFLDPDEFESWRSAVADLYYALLHASAAKIALDCCCATAPQDIMGHLNGTRDGRFLHRFLSMEKRDTQQHVDCIAKATVFGIVMREITLRAEGLSQHADPDVRSEARELQAAVQALGLIYARISAALLKLTGVPVSASGPLPLSFRA